VDKTYKVEDSSLCDLTVSELQSYFVIVWSHMLPLQWFFLKFMVIVSQTFQDGNDKLLQIVICIHLV